MTNWYTHITQTGETLSGIQNYGGTYNVGVSQDITAKLGTFSGAVSGTTGTFSGAVSGTTGTFSGLLTAASFSSNVKSFNIPHPTKEGKRLWHGCLEGPEHAVYVRGRITGNNLITLPEYWSELIDENSITVQLQPIGDRHFHLNVLEFDKQRVVIKEADDKPIDCFYTITATRKDVPLLEVEQDS